MTSRKRKRNSKRNKRFLEHDFEIENVSLSTLHRWKKLCKPGM